jgi:hypothetical protein
MGSINAFLDFIGTLCVETLYFAKVNLAEESRTKKLSVK